MVTIGGIVAAACGALAAAGATAAAPLSSPSSLSLNATSSSTGEFSSGATKTFTLNIQTFTAAPDGVAVNVYGVNNAMQVPIIVNRGDKVVVNVKNSMQAPTAIHWHGLFQRGTNAYDGAAGVTQCPIQPGKKFAYKFSIPDQHGTYWWHAHYKAQYVKGIRGPLIVRDPDNEPYTNMYDEERIVMLTDWYHARTSDELLTPFLDSESGNEPLPDSGLINGKGRYDCAKVKDGKPCTPNAPREVFQFKAGKSYRLRIINGGAQAVFTFSIDGHKLQVIEADGIDTQLTTVDTLRISPGQRYSVIVKADADAACNHWMRATIDPLSYTQYDEGVFDPNVLAVVTYTNSNADPTTTGPPENAVALDQYKLLPYKQTPLPAVPDITFGFSFAIVPDEENHSRAFVSVDGQFDMTSYAPPTGSPTIIQTVDGKDLTGTSVNPVYLSTNQVVDMVIYNDDPMEHPFHLHGHTFQIINTGLALNAPMRPSAQTVYPERDTVTIPPCRIKVGGSGEGICGGTKGYVHIRFLANNPGIWLFHCHVEWHMMQGLGMTFITDAPAIQRLGVPQNVRDQCGSAIKWPFFSST